MNYIVRYYSDAYPPFMVDHIDHALQLIGGLIGVNGLTSLQSIAYSDGSLGVKASKTDTLLGWSIIPN